MTTVVGRTLPAEHEAARALVHEVCGPGGQLSGAQGWATLTNLCWLIESQFEAVLLGLDGLDTFEGFRRVSGRLWQSSSIEHQLANRHVCELAIHRYCDWSAVRLPSRAPRPWRSWELALLARLVALGDLYANALAARRWIGKGAAVTVSDRLIPFEHVPDAKLERLVNLRDTRGRSDPNPLATVGALWRADAPVDTDRQLIVAHLIDPTLRTPSFPLSDRLVDWAKADTVEGELHLLARLSAGLPGFSLRDLHFALDLAATAAQVAWAIPPITLVNSGYVLARSLPYERLVEHVERARRSHLPQFRDVSVEATARALNFLDAGVANTDLDVPLAQRPLRRMGDHLLYDALNVRLAGPMFWDLELPARQQDAHARTAEDAVHHQLASFGLQPWNSGRKLRESGRIVTDVDASVVIGQLLVVVDTYASPWSADLDRGLHSVTRNRMANLRRKLAQWDQRWADIVSNRKHLLPAGVTQVFPVVVSTTAEWIDDDSDPKEWITPEIPRICTGPELFRLLDEGFDLRANPAVLDV